jgi:hypothetical protein
VSIVVDPWRRLTSAARWIGQAHQITTGDARANDSHAHSSNRSAGTIDMATTGSARTAAQITRSRRGSGAIWRRSRRISGAGAAKSGFTS